jgi:beta-galactosidase
MKKTLAVSILALSILTACNNEGRRKTIPLNGTWQIAEGTMAAVPGSFDRSVPVPGLVSLASPPFVNTGPKVANRRDLVQADTLREAFWYRRTFNIEGKIPLNATLRIAKAMFGTKVVLNGRDLGEHLPSFTPGYFNVKDALKVGENTLLIRVGSCRNSVPPSVPDGFDFEKDRYIPGIFDNVELILGGSPYIVSAQAAPDIYGKQVRIQVKLLNNGEKGNSDVTFIVNEARSGIEAGRINRSVTLPSGSGNEITVDTWVPIRDCKLWSPEDPFLYNLTVTTRGDEYKTRFGMREFRLDTLSGMTMLNGKPYFMRGSNITLYRFFEDDACGSLPWDSVWVRNLHKSFKQFHWNGLRYCIGIAPDDWYRIADEEGIMIQNEFPVWYGGKGWNSWPPELKSDELAREYAEWVSGQWNHPSIIIWDASNETVSNDGKTEEIAAAISRVRSIDLSNRPWDNSYSDIRSPGDVMELHPYHFQNPEFRLKDLSTADINPGGDPDEKRFIKIINEYGWLWLNRDGTPTTLTKDLYDNLLGRNSTTEQRRHLYAMYLAAETEFWRCHRKCSSVLHFVSLAYSRPDGQTSDHFIDVGRLIYEPEFLKYMPDAFSPAGLMLDEWGNDIKTGAPHDFNVLAINDLEKEWKGKMFIRIYDGNSILAEQVQDISIPPFGQGKFSFSLITPQKAGIYTVVASLERENEEPVRSVREIPFRM